MISKYLIISIFLNKFFVLFWRIILENDVVYKDVNNAFRAN